MQSYILSLTIIGLAALSVVWILPLLNRLKISYSLFYLLLGIILYSLPLNLPWPDPLWKQDYAIHLTELSIIIALMGTGLKIDRPFSFKGWRHPFRLVTITMLISIGMMAFAAWWCLGFDPAAAVLLGAVLAPTDPVLASDVQVGPPMEDKESDVRFSLTAEAGLNDGMAFPFTLLAVAIAATTAGQSWFGEWVWKDLFYKIIAGIMIGYGLGKAIAYLLFNFPNSKPTPQPAVGLIALSATLLVYGATELASGYGFVAVFVAAVVIRNHKMDHEYYTELNRFNTQIEQILLVILLILFGGSLVIGLLDYLNWVMALVGLSFIFILRPLAGIIGLTGTMLDKRKKITLSFFGIKGIGSFYYLSFALSEAPFKNKEEIWAIVAFVVLSSIVIHGLSAPFSFEKLELKEKEDKS